MFKNVEETIKDHPIITTILILTIVGIPILVTWICRKSR